MKWVAEKLRNPRSAGLACAVGAVGMGIVYLVAASAPTRMVAMNLAALIVGVAAFATVTVPNWRIGRAGALVPPALGLVLLATALLGTSIAGAARWASLGPLNLQVSLIVLPAMIMLFARRANASGALGLGIAALALALQPDRAMAGVLAAATAAAMLCRAGRWAAIALAAAVTSFAVTLVRADNLPAVPFVDQIFFSSFSIHPLIGAVVIAGAVLLVLPALAAGRGAGRTSAIVFGTLWGIVALAAALGNYPTPLVGYGGSAIVGYLLSLALLPSMAVGAGSASRSGSQRPDDRDGRSLSASLA